ncbi:MAG: tetratricopeptide repeat protein [Gemmatimonadota bacterium]
MKTRVMIGLALVTVLGACRSGDRPLAGGAISENDIRNRDIALYERRVREDPASAADLAQLAGLYMQRAREVGDYEDFRRAEAAARTSWSMRGSRNGKALHMLASAQLAQHKFLEARASAETLVRLDPDIISWRALLAEIELELGDYESAARSFQSLEVFREDLSVAPRLARWYEINGRRADAQRLLAVARDAAARRPDLPREQKAWFYLRTADFAVRNGRLREAEREAWHGLEVNPGDVRLVSLLARVASERQDWDEVVALLGSNVDRADIAALSLLGDAYARLGGGALADNVFRLIERRAAENPEPFNRQWTQFRLDHGIELPETVALLEREASIRPDKLGLAMVSQGRALLSGPRSGAGVGVPNSVVTKVW